MAELKIDLDIETGRAERDSKNALNKAGRVGAASFAAGFRSNLGLIAGAIASVAALAKSINFFKESIRAAAVQQQAINDLNTQLSITGQFTQQVSQDLQNFATQLQSTSRFGDEAILSQLAFAQALGATAEQSKAIVAAGADLAESLNIDLNAAVRNIGRTLGGFGGELSEVIPELKNLTQEQLRAGAAIDLLAEKFAGAAQGRIRTFSGATAQLSNTFGDFQESIGAVITNSPAFIAAINTTTKLIGDLTSSLSGISNQDPFKNILLGAVGLARTLNEIIAPIRVVFGAFQTGINALKLGVQAFATFTLTIFNNTFGRVLEGLSLIPGKVGKIASEAREILANATSAVQEQLGVQAETVLDDLVTPEQTEAFKNRIDEIINSYQSAIEKSQQFKAETTKSFSETGKEVAKTASTVGASLNNTLGNAVASGIESITKSLIAGENVFKAFGQAALGLVADFAIQAGKLFVATGIAQLALFSSPAASIAAGAALIAAGTLAKSFFGGSKGGDATQPAGVSQGPLPTQPEFVSPTADERVEPETRVNVVINGSVFDSEETGLRISKILENASLNENVRIVGGIA